MIPFIYAFITGAVVGAVCVGGLHYGMKLLVDAMNHEGPAVRKRIKMLLGAGILCGQFLGALAILYFSPGTKANPLGLCLGMILAIFSVSFVLKPEAKK